MLRTSASCWIFVLSLTNTALVYSLTLPAMLSIDPVLTLVAVGPYPVMLACVRLFGSHDAAAPSAGESGRSE